MEKIKAIIIDDESLAREVIKQYLASFPEIQIVGECSNGFEGVKFINELKPDLVFLDIQMPKITGFEMLELLDELPVIIFTTAYDQYALKAFEINAADYLLKPFSEERLFEAISKALLFLNDRNRHNNVIKNIVSHLDQKEEFLERIVVKSGTKIHLIPAQTIIYIEAQDDYVMFYTSGGKFLKQKTMKYFEDHLNPAEFIRIHRSYIVKLSEIKQIELFEKESFHVILNNNVSIPVSKSGYSRLKEIFK
ncbi:MAG: LytR/AlgR family response regulator transcription factor [Ignavibacteriales bacterium]